MADIQISARAYCKMMLHAAKYPHCAVNGVLLAENVKSEKKGKHLVIKDAIPLFHVCLNVSPMAEIALTQIDHKATATGLIIAGYYLANENIKDVNYEKAGNRIADKIAENFNSACLAVIDNQKLKITMDDVALCVSQFTDGKWKPKDRSGFTVESNTLDATATLIQHRAYDELFDFDNHLDDISQDWMNLKFNCLVEEEVGEVE